MRDQSRLRFRCRRGMKELDVLLERYVAQHYTQAPAAEQVSFERLLDCEDPDLWAWILGQALPPPEFAHVIERLQRNA